jgi:hypothetical protein
VRRTALVLGGLLLAGCGARATTQAAAPQVAVPCSTATVSLSVGAQLSITGCPVGTVAASMSALLRQQDPYAFFSVGTGMAVITLTGRPVCAPGTLCPQYRVLIGSVTVLAR